MLGPNVHAPCAVHGPWLTAQAVKELERCVLRGQKEADDKEKQYVADPLHCS